MKAFVVAFGVASAFALVHANAQGMVSDTDGDGVFSMEELRAAFPTLTEKNFVASDTNADGAIDMKELAAAVSSGKIPT